MLVIGNADVPSFGSELREGLRELGRIEGQHYLIEFRSAEGQLGRLPELALELVRLKVDVIIVLFTPCALAAKQDTREIPIKFKPGPKWHILQFPAGCLGLLQSFSQLGGADARGSQQFRQAGIISQKRSNGGDTFLPQHRFLAAMIVRFSSASLRQ